MVECDFSSVGEPAQGGVHPCEGLITGESWWAKMKAEISECVFFGGLDVDLLQPNCLTEAVRQLVDLDFGRWMKTITANKLAGVEPKRRPRRKPRQGHEESTTRKGLVVPQGSGNDGKKCGKPRSRPKQRRGRETFKKVQDLFKKKWKAVCASCFGWKVGVSRLQN